MKKTSLLIALLFAVHFSAQTNSQKPYIEVTGTSEIEIVPDEIYLEICLKERNEKGRKLTIEVLENQLKSTLKSIGIPKENLSISDVNSVLAKTGWWTEEIFSIANYNLKITGANKLKLLFEKLKILNISDVNITKATHSNIKKIRNSNRINAIKIAKQKASNLLSAIGEQIGKPQIINEINTGNQSNFVNANFVNTNRSYLSLNKVKSSNNEVVQFKKIKILSSVYVKFLIK